MSLPVALAVYFICWWLVFFAVLPVGVRTQADEDTIAPGTADSAPVAPRLLRKVFITTVIAGAVFAIVYAVIAFRVIPLDLIPASL